MSMHLIVVALTISVLVAAAAGFSVPCGTVLGALPRNARDARAQSVDARI